MKLVAAGTEEKSVCAEMKAAARARLCSLPCSKLCSLSGVRLDLVRALRLLLTGASAVWEGSLQMPVDPNPYGGA